MLAKLLWYGRCDRQARQRWATGRGGIVAGCLIALGVVVLLAVIGAIIVAMNWQKWTASLLNKGMVAAVDETSLSLEEKQSVKAVIDDFTDEFRQGNITIQQFGQVVQEITESPMLPGIVFASLDKMYIQGSALSDEEKTQASKDVGRFVRGVFDGSISQTRIDDVTEPLHYKGGGQGPISIHANNLNIELKNPKDVTLEELKDFVANAKAEADKASVPDEAFTIDYASELKAAIDRALGRAPALEHQPATTNQEQNPSDEQSSETGQSEQEQPDSQDQPDQSGSGDDSGG